MHRRNRSIGARVLVVALLLPALVLGLLPGSVQATAPGTDGDLVYSLWDTGSETHRIYTVNPAATEGGSTRLVWSGPGRHRYAGLNPSWSPSGTIAFSARPGGDTGAPLTIHRIRPDGSGLRTLPTGHINDYEPAFSPDGGRIAFTAEVRDDSGPPRLTWERWSPPAPAPVATYIYVMNSDGTGIERVTLPIKGGDPAWSPDGARIAFSDKGDLFSIMPDGRDLQQMTRTTEFESEPSYSPDGQMLAFTRGFDVYQLHVPTGGGVTKLSPGSDGFLSPVFSPTGNEVALVHQTNSAERVGVIPAAGGGVRHVPHNLSHNVLDVDWGSAIGTPDTMITDGPANGDNTSWQVTFGYRSTAPNGGFVCRLTADVHDGFGHDWQPCGAAPNASKSYDELGKDTYTFAVKAVNAEGVEDPSPATRRFTVASEDESRPPLTVTKSGTGFGTVTSEPKKLSCGEEVAECSARFSGMVKLIAEPAGDSVFKGWKGACNATSPTCTVSMTEAKTVEAAFELNIAGRPRCSNTFSVGNWSFEGCFDKIGSIFETQELFRINGLTVYPAEAGKIQIDTSAMSLSVSGTIAVAAGPAHIAGRKIGPIVLYRDDVGIDLRAPAFTLEAPGSANLLGLQTMPKIDFKAPSPGAVDVDLDVNLPDVLGGGQVDASFSADRTSGLKVGSLKVGPTSASVAGILQVQDTTFSYNENGWSASGKVITPGAQGSFSGRFDYSGSTLTAAAVNVPEVTIAGVLDTSNFKLTYDREKGVWQAAANVNGPSGPSLAGSFVYRSGLLRSAQMTGSRIGVFGLVTVNSFSFDYNNLTGWSATGNVAGAVGGEFSATFRYQDSVLETGDVSIKGLKIVDAFSLQNLSLAYQNRGDSEHWSGTADVGGIGALKADVNFTLAQGGLRSGKVQVSNVNLFDVLEVKDFHASYDGAAPGGGTKWALRGTAEVPGSGLVSLDSAAAFGPTGQLTSGHFKLANASLGGVLKVNDFWISYKGGATWGGKADITLPGPKSPGFKVDVAFTDGNLTKAYGEYRGVNWPVGGGVFIESIAAGVETAPNWSVSGGLGITGGPSITLPQVGALAAAAIDGGLTLRLPQWDASGVLTTAGGFRIDGKAKLVNVPLADGFIDYQAPLNVSLAGCLADCEKGFKPVDWATVTARVEGAIRGLEAFQVGSSAKVELCLNLKPCKDPNVIEGQALLSNVGVAGCGTVWVASLGVSYKWGDKPAIFHGCDLSEFESIPRSARLAVPTARQYLANQAGVLQVDVPSDAKVHAVRVKGTTGPPAITLTGPNGEKIETRKDPSNVGIKDDHLVAIDVAGNETVVVLNQPAAGRWDVSLQPGSSPLASAKTSEGLPEAEVTATVTGSATQQTLSWNATPIDGQTITFVEEGAGTSAVLHETTASSGTVGFTPAAGEAGMRTIVAQVTQDGLPRGTFDVATYDAPQVDELTVTLAGAGAGSMTSDPAGIDCRDDCTTLLDPSGEITLTATAEPGSVFAGWDGVCGGTDATCTVSPGTSAGVTATFRKDTGPEVAAVDATKVAVGDPVTIEGAGLLGTTDVAFGGISSDEVVVIGDNVVLATVPMGAKSGAVTVRTSSGTGESGFKIKVRPRIDAFSPAKAKRGKKVKLVGMSFVQIKKIKIGKIAVKNYRRLSYTELKLTVPKKARKGKIKVITAGGKAVAAIPLKVKR